MFYSRCLLLKKGVLGNVWVAAHCFKKLKKEQVKQIDIASSVDTILKGEANMFAYRILAFLLLGVAKIYSKKVEFLFHDCHDVLDKLHSFMADKIVNKSITPTCRSYHSITLPERFELDAFDLDVSEDQDVSRVDVSSRGDITLADASRGVVYCKNDKYYGQEDIPLHEVFSSACTPVRDVCPPWFMDIDSDTTSSYDISSLKSSMQKLFETSFLLEKSLEPKMFGDVEREPGFDMSFDEGHQTDVEQIKHHDVEINYHQPARMEKSIDNRSLESMTLDDVEKESGFDVLLDEGQTEGKQIKCPDLDISCQEPTGMEKSIDNESMEPILLGETEKEPGFGMPSDEGHQTDGEQVKHPDVEINCQEPATMEELIDNEQSMEKLREFGFSLADHLQPVILGEVAQESPIAMPSKEGHQMVEEQIKHPDARINFEEAEEMRLPQMSSLRNRTHEKSSLSVSINVTPDSKIAGGSGDSSPVLAVRTPATKEHARVLKKRKCLFDEKVVFSNRVIKDWIDDSSDLVCKRRKAPPTAFHAWKVHKIYTLPKSIFEPLIPCVGIDFGSPVSWKKSIARVFVETAENPVDPVLVESSATQMSVKPVESPVNPILVKSPAMQMSVKATEAPVNPILVASPDTQMSCEQNPIAPATPVTQSSSLRLLEVRGVSKPDMFRPPSSFDSVDKQPTLKKDLESDIGLMDEEVNSSLGYNPGKCEWSVRTRRVARYLHQNISNLTEQNGEGFVNLSQVLEQKTRTESARLFYEILALKTGDYIDVRQEDAYGDILVQETPKLKQTLDADGNRFLA